MGHILEEQPSPLAPHRGPAQQLAIDEHIDRLAQPRRYQGSRGAQMPCHTFEMDAQHESRRKSHSSMTEARCSIASAGSSMAASVPAAAGVGAAAGRWQAGRARQQGGRHVCSRRFWALSEAWLCEHVAWPREAQALECGSMAGTAERGARRKDMKRYVSPARRFLRRYHASAGCKLGTQIPKRPVDRLRAHLHAQQREGREERRGEHEGEEEGARGARRA